MGGIMSLLSTQDLCKSFGTLGVTRNVSLAIEEGERHVIIGPNGAGKTSLLNQIGGQLSSDAGEIHLRGRNVTGLPPETICHLGIARTFQKNNLFQNLTTIENVRLAVQAKRGRPFSPLRSVTGGDALENRAAEFLAVVGLDGRARVPVRHLSYGEQRELEIACALASEPVLLLLDEPTSGLSQAETRRMIERISSLPRTIGLLMIEHDLDVVFSIADRISVLYYGEVIATGLPDAVSSDARVREVYLGAYA